MPRCAIPPPETRVHITIPLWMQVLHKFRCREGYKGGIYHLWTMKGTTWDLGQITMRFHLAGIYNLGFGFCSRLKLVAGAPDRPLMLPELAGGSHCHFLPWCHNVFRDELHSLIEMYNIVCVVVAATTAGGQGTLRVLHAALAGLLSGGLGHLAADQTLRSFLFTFFVSLPCFV